MTTRHPLRAALMARPRGRLTAAPGTAPGAPLSSEENPMHFAEDEAERLPIGAFDTLSSGRDRKTRFVGVRYRAPNLIEKWYGLPIAVAAYLVATVIFSRVDYGLVVAFFIVFAVVSVRNDNVERNISGCGRRSSRSAGALPMLFRTGERSAQSAKRPESSCPSGVDARLLGQLTLR